jgi:hypothetical protein
MNYTKLSPSVIPNFSIDQITTRIDAIDLLIICSSALKQCHSQGYASMDISTAIGFSDCLQDSFSTGLDDSDNFMNSVLTIDEWWQLAFLVSGHGTAIKFEEEID